MTVPFSFFLFPWTRLGKPRWDSRWILGRNLDGIFVESWRDLGGVSGWGEGGGRRGRGGAGGGKVGLSHVRTWKRKKRRKKNHSGIDSLGG